MPERGFDSGYWTDPFVQTLPLEGKALYVYLWTNNHCNQAGLYEITPETISFEMKLEKERISELMRLLEPKVKWYPSHNLVWVKNFLKRQAKSSKFLQAAAKSLTTVHVNGAIKEFLEYNLQRYRILIPYQYYMDRVSIPSISASSAVSDSMANSGRGLGVVKGEGIKGREAIPRSESETEESLCEGDREVISIWCSVKGFSMPNEEAAQLVARLRTDFPDIDIRKESKAWAVRKLSEPLGPNSRASSQLWHWMSKARGFAQERSAVEQGKDQRVRGSRTASDFRGGKW
jgi:hypothetical protein